MQHEIALRDVVDDGVEFAVAHGHASAEERRVLDALLVTADDARIVRRLRRRRRNGDPLGFGIGEVAAVLGPVLMIAVEESFRTVAAGLTGSLLGVWLQRLFRRQPVAATLHELPREQLRTMHDLMVHKLVEARIPDDTARAVADRVTAALVLGDDGAQGGEDEGAADATGSEGEGPDEQGSGR